MSDAEAPQEESWGADPSKPDADRLPDPPPMPGEKVQPAPDGVLAVGPPPGDAAGDRAWAHKVLMAYAHETLLDKDMTQTQRMSKFVKILGVAHKYYPDAAKHDLAEVIKGERLEREGKRANQANAKSERRRAPPASAKVIPIRGEAQRNR